VLGALAERLPADTVVVEETPSSRPDLHRLLPARRPPVVAVVGDGSSLYGIQALWSAAHYGCGVLFVVLANGRYAIMDRLAEQHRAGGKAPWPGFEEVSVHRLATGLGCPVERIESYSELADALDEVDPGLRSLTSPLVREVPVLPDPTFEP
jgi:benzoylformate decarboxylase